jgi:hypothetical protein
MVPQLLINFSEYFSVTGYNDTTVPQNRQDTLYETEAKELNDMFEQWNTDIFPSDFRGSYQKLPSYIKFAWQDIISKLIIISLKEVFSKYKKYKDSKIKIVKDMYDIYWYDDNENTQHLIFNIDVNNATLKWTRRIKIYIKIRDIKSFLSDTGDYIKDLDENGLSQLEKNISIVTISLEESTARLLVPGFGDKIGSEVFDNYYNILNPLHLMDPYITSGKQMVITDEMRSRFSEELEERKRREQERQKGGFCYNTTNLLANTKEECIDSGGIWDYPPDSPYECPYYLSNENYPNNFGGLRGDKCELPKNMQIIGNRNFSMDPKYRPLCYNCNRDTSLMVGQGTLGYCCDDQNDRMKYPNLITPDYAFDADKTLREKYSDKFFSKGLNIV